MIEGFSIAAVAAGPGRIGICRLPGRSGDIDGDVAAIRAWAPAVVVSMTEAAEMVRFGAAGLPALLARDGIGWRHFPIIDFGAPEGEVFPIWSALTAELHAALDAGGGVLLHCRAGLGRSGMVALRLLVERGEDAGAALDRIRAARPGAVETGAQAEWAGARTASTSASDAL